MRGIFLFGLIGFISVLTGAEPLPLVHAHAHNDYEHARPLFDALDRGFCSIEADVYLIDGRLLVAHDRKEVRPERTLARLYLEPLQVRVQRNGGHVLADGTEVTLLVDVKSEARATYAAVHAELEKFGAMLTTFRAGERIPGAVTVIISGNRDREDMAAQTVRYAAMDGREEDLSSSAPAVLVPLVSENWRKVFRWNWEGAMPPAERQRLEEWVERAHRHGRKVRFWNTPDRADAWSILIDAGVDLIGTDDLDGLQRFFVSRQKRQ